MYRNLCIEIGTEAAHVLFLVYFFRIFGIMTLQCVPAMTYTVQKQNIFLVLLDKIFTNPFFTMIREHRINYFSVNYTFVPHDLTLKYKE